MRRMGMTEAFWKTKNEDWRFYWKLTARAVAMIASFFVAKTGIDFLDKVMMIFTAVLPMLITESQRSYTSFSLKLGKRIIKVCTFLSTCGIVLIGLLIFSQVLLHSLAKTYLETVSPLVLNGGNGYVILIMLLSLLWAGVTVARRSFNDLQVWQIIYHLPKRGMIQLLAARRYPAKTREAFVIFELSVIFFSFMYVSTFCSAIEPFLTLIRNLHS